MYRFPSAAREQKKNRLCTSRQTAGDHREHCARCKNTSKTSRMHAPATVDDEHGYFLIGHVCRETTRIDENRPQEPSPPNHVENQKRSIYCAHFSPCACRHAGKRREHSARCRNTSNTSKKHATGVVDDERGHFIFGKRTGREATRIDLRIRVHPSRGKS